MARYPAAIWKPVERYQPGGSVHVPMSEARRLCYHTAVSSGDSLFALFNTPGNPVAHFYIRQDGRVEQYVDTGTRASANLEGNPDTIAVESWDDGGKRETWTPAQVEGCAQLAAWVHDKHGIPFEYVDASPGSHGITAHRKGIDGNFPSGPLLSGRKAGDEHWSLSGGKECPFDGKIRGLVDDIIPRAREIAEGDWFDMATKADLRDVVDAAIKDATPAIAETVRREILFDSDLFPNDPDKDVTVNSVLAKLYNSLSATAAAKVKS
jgi:hypothetical protein